MALATRMAFGSPIAVASFLITRWQMNRPVMKRFSIVTTCPQHVVPENLPEIATQLGVAHILEGSVQKSGDAVRVNVQPTKLPMTLIFGPMPLIAS